MTGFKTDQDRASHGPRTGRGESLGTVAQHWLAKSVPFAMIEVASALGSTPREQGTIMLVNPLEVAGTIGGGRLEWDAIAAARDLLATGQRERNLDIALGPAIGQCCGGRVALRLVRGDVAGASALLARDIALVREQPAVLIHGAGHVGRALAKAMAPLPCKVTLIDGRQDELDRTDAPGVTLLQSEAMVSLAEQAPDGAAHVVMTHSHALDSLIAGAVLEQNRFRYLGIIGSRTKRRSFRRAFREMGIAPERIDRVVCPIGGTELRDKRPEVIAAMAAAEILISLFRPR